MVLIMSTAMSHSELTHAIRDLVIEGFSQLGLAEGEEPRQVLVIRGGAYCGRRFEIAGGHAVWFIDEDQLKFFTDDGGIVRVVEDVSQARLAARLAA
jgi:hypothetical protein